MKRIEYGQFVKLSELLPSRLSITASEDDTSKATKSKTTLSIVEWVQGFGIYTAVLSKFQPNRVADLLGYQTLILQAYTDFKGDRWQNYDRTFRLKNGKPEGLKVVSHRYHSMEPGIFRPNC